MKRIMFLGLIALVLAQAGYALETEEVFCGLNQGSGFMTYLMRLGGDPEWAERASVLFPGQDSCFYSRDPALQLNSWDPFGDSSGTWDWFMARLSIPEDFKLVSSDGHVVGDELCLGERFQLQKGVNRGEFWQEGGEMDSPPIYWVNDVQEMMYSLVKKKADACIAGRPPYTRRPFRELFRVNFWSNVDNETILGDKAQQENFRQYLKEMGYVKLSEDLLDAQFEKEQLSSSPNRIVAKKNGEEIAAIRLYAPSPYSNPVSSDNFSRCNPDSVKVYCLLLQVNNTAVTTVAIEAGGQDIAYLPYVSNAIVYAEDAVRKNGEIDPLTGIPIYRMYNYYGTYYFDVGVACSLRDNSSTQGLGKDAAGWYSLTTKGLAEYKAVYDIDCTYYLYGAGSYLCPRYTERPCYVLIQMPSIREDPPDPVYNLMYGQGLHKLFHIGSVGISKTIKVVEPANPKVDVSVSGANKLALNQPNVLRVLVRNSGDVDVDLADVRSNAAYKFVSCDAKTVKPGETKECLIEVTPQVGEGVSVSVNYGYRTCGRAMKGVASKEVLSSQVVKASSMSQVYALDVSGGCVNRYYVCNSALEQPWFSLGYKCSTNEANKYVVSSVERIDLGFGLPALPEGATVAGARLGLTASGASKAQDVSVYSIPALQDVFCLPGGDICAQPYCSECKPLFDASGQQLGTTYVAGPGKYYVDLTEAVKEAYQNEARRVSLQLRGKEDYSADSGSCGTGKDWIQYDLNFRGKTDAPYLEIVYAK